jgi:hypothetical protein
MPRFRSLPAELRLDIWELALPDKDEPRVLPWHHAHDAGEYPQVISPQPSIYNVCQESRAVVDKKKYNMTWVDNSRDERFDNVLIRPYNSQDAVYVVKSQFPWFRKHQFILQNRHPSPEARDWLRQNRLLTKLTHLALDSSILFENPSKVRLWFRKLPRCFPQLRKITIVVGKQWARPALRPSELMGKGNKARKSNHQEYEAVAKEWEYKEIEPPLVFAELKVWSCDQSVRLVHDDPASSRRVLDLYTELRTLLDSTKPFDDVPDETRWNFNNFIPAWDIKLVFAELLIKKWA